MIRRFGFVILVLALIVSACGHQVTPDRPGTNASGLPSGFMSVKFRVDQPFNFQNYSYMIVFNTNGDGTTPRANGTQTNYQCYSFAILVTASGTGSPTAIAYQYYRPPGYTAPQLIALQPTQQQLQFYPNTNGQNTEFTVIFARSIFFGINNTPPPSSSSPSASPSASPTTSPSTSPSPVPTQSGAPAANWQFNFFVAQGSLSNLIPVDSLGSGGPSDTTYSSPTLDTTTQFDIPITLQVGNHPSDQGPDNIQSGEIANNP